MYKINQRMRAQYVQRLTEKETRIKQAHRP